ncbi:hypothetical protein QE152_g32021 [Popillia japonica]|uniref:Uncharacterized protein n=1 Tax=Popillia japonica TaxID=7064 RepID=A0AAW1J0S5_POPJA
MHTPTLTHVLHIPKEVSWRYFSIHDRQQGTEENKSDPTKVKTVAPQKGTEENKSDPTKVKTVAPQSGRNLCRFLHKAQRLHMADSSTYCILQWCRFDFTVFA